ncbi:hypothetical protein [Streptomyces halstedii]|uniref:Uncharacterized protein n=1 Tax=Streptomyces halstedii TaxID=1944 RepID=A0A6N9U7N7_STRHA|nr:hypothetical protein [Streptomyces halstedii]NEA19851.1 hypothetical protein [Streptomyces halstedii]
MSAPTISREQAITNARRILDMALDRIARDRAAGRLTPEAVDRLRLAEARYARQQPRNLDRAAA